MSRYTENTEPMSDIFENRYRCRYFGIPKIPNTDN